MAKRQLPFIGAFQEGRVTRFQGQRLLNWIPEIQREGSRSKMVLHPAPGLVELGTVSEGPHRAPRMARWRNRLYGVSGSVLYSTNAGGAVIEHANLATNTGLVSLAAGRNELAIVDGFAGYSWDGATLTQIAPATPLYDDSPTVAYLDGYFVTHQDNKFQVSALEDFTTHNSLDFNSAEGAADDVVAVVSNAQDLYIVGEWTTEPFYNAGAAAGTPFRQYSNNVIRYGTPAPFSVAEAPPGVFMLAQTELGDMSVVHLIGQDARVISDVDLDWQLSRVAVVGDAYGWCYQQLGQWYYQLTLPSAGKTWVYGIQSGMWHERETYGKGQHRAASHGYLNRVHLVGDFESGKIYRLDPDVYKDAELQIIRRRITPVMHANGDIITFNEITLEFESGVGLLPGATVTEDDGADPEVRMSYSDNGAEFGPWMREPLGKIGERFRKTTFSGLGDSTDRVFKIEISAPVPASLADAYAEIEIDEN